MSKLVTLFLMSCTISSGQTLAGRYEFWDYYGYYLYDYSGNSRHAEIKNSPIIPVLADRGLYISDGYSLKLPKNTYKDFPSSCTDMVVSVLFLPQTDKKFCLIKLIEASHNIEVCFESEFGEVKISIEGSRSYTLTTTKAFNLWRLYTIRFSQVSSGTFLYIYLDGDDTNTALTFMINSFSFSAVDTRWEVGSNSIEGFLYQIWWHCQVSISIKTLSSSMFNSPSSPCTTLYAMTPFKKCLSNQLNKFKNSENEDCTTCIGSNQSCDKDQICIDSCQYKCISPSGCRSVFYPICSTTAPSHCLSIPGTDICTKCNIGWAMSTLNPGVCDITVPGCKIFDSSGQCLECLPGHYRTTTSPPICIPCGDGCEACSINSSGVITCTKCPADQYHHTSPLCVSACPSTFYGNSLTNQMRCSSCPSNCKVCTYNTNLKTLICTECIDGFYLQHNVPFYLVQCAKTCPVRFYPDNINSPKECKYCIEGCDICTSNSRCSICGLGYMLSLDGTICIKCVIGCISCLSTTECSQCGYYYWLDQNKNCKICSGHCRFCSNSYHCDACDDFGIEVIIDGIRTCRPSCSYYYYILGTVKSCVEYNSNKLNVTLCSEDSNGIVTCRNCLTSELLVNNCPPTICSSQCRKCKTVDGALRCLTCKTGFYMQPDNSSCNQTCPDFYYNDDTIKACGECASNCKKCQSNISGCEECGNDYNLDINSSSCVLNCPVGYYSDRSGIWACKSCINNCEVCNSSTNCFKCASGFYLVTYLNGVVSCEIACSTRMYFDGNRVCHYCMNNCDVCGMNSSGVLICSTCSVGYILISGDCVELICDPNCINCVISSTVLRCDLCVNGYYIDPTGYKCLTNCPTKYYADTGNNRCVACMANCETCIEATMSKPTCDLCSPNHIFNSSTGVNLCEYTTCPESCTDCNILSSGITCNSCNLNYFMQPSFSLCKISCPKGYYGDTSDKMCKMCTNNCDECDMNGCIICIDEYYLQPDLSCNTSCPTKYYHQDTSRVCSVCPSNCLSCELNELNLICTKCEDAFYLSLDGTCKYSCEEGFKSNPITKRCEKCIINKCSSCESQSDTTAICTKCQVNYYLLISDTTSCNLECPHGYYKDDSLEIKICRSCTEGCKICYSSTNCLECEDNYYKQPDGYSKLCDVSCPEQYYEDENLNIKTCKVCEEDCNSCAGCSGCMDLNLVSELILMRCFKICPFNYYLNTSNICSQCEENCKRCTSSVNCLECENGFYLQPYGNEFIEISACSPCRSNCKVCSNSIDCIECEYNYYIQPYGDIACSKNCPLEYYKSHISPYRCLPCREDCLVCDENICMVCKNDYYLLYTTTHSCTLSCPESYFPSDLNGVKICSACSKGCLRCNNSELCDECNEDYIMISGSCMKCDIENCFSCKDTGSEKVCAECKEGYYLIDHNIIPCVTQCPDGFYINSSKKCTKCIKNCRECTQETDCRVCISGYYYDTQENACLTNNLKNCLKGSTIEKKFVCSECEENYYRIDSNIEPCIYECPESYYPESTNNIKSCQQCMANCKSCTRYDICEKCNDGTSNKEVCSLYTAAEIAQAQTVSETTSNLSTASTATSIGVGTIGYNLQNAWSIMNTVQIFSYLSLIQVDMPKNLKDAINSKSESKLIPNIYMNELKGHNQPKNIAQKERFDTTSLIWNCRKDIMLLYTIVVIHLLVKFVSSVFKGKIKALSDKVLKMFFWKIYSRYFILSYFDILNASFLQLLYVIYN